MPIPVIAGAVAGAPWLTAGAAAAVGFILRGLMWMFKSKLGYWIAAAAVWLGINWGTLTLIIDPVTDLLLGYAQNSTGAGGQFAETAQAWMGVLNFDKALTMIVSAVATKNAILNLRLMWFRAGATAAT